MRPHHAFWPRRLPHALTVPATSLWDNLEISARRYPDKAGLVFFGRRISYREMADTAERLAAHMHAQGVRKGDRVIAVHAKDGTLDPSLLSAYPPADQVAAGEGVVPLVEAIAAAPALELAIVEFDHFDGDLWDAIERSRVYLDEKVAG